jgi:hypothetical protein
MIAAMLFLFVFGAYLYSEEHPKSAYVSPRYCFNGEDNFKSDVCSKIGMQWPL